ncbi:MAG: VOC family protein [Deltaproteobacteria bacterium]|nr:VOC family protein [Deltaproteobacteria bacterium]
MRVEHLGIYANDSEGLSRWYREKLGFSVVRKLEKEGRPPIYFLEGEGGWQIEILPSPSPPHKRELTDPGYSHVGLVVEDFDRTAGLLQSKGISLHDVRDTSNGWKIGYFEDPEGNRLEIVYRPRGG